MVLHKANKMKNFLIKLFSIKPEIVYKTIIKETYVLPNDDIIGDLMVKGDLNVLGSLTVTGEITAFKINQNG